MAEFRYGVITALEKQLKEASLKLNEVQKSKKMLKEEVDAEDIAEIVATVDRHSVETHVGKRPVKASSFRKSNTREIVDQEEAVKAVAMQFEEAAQDCRMSGNR